MHMSLIHHLNVKIFLYFLSGCQNGLLYVWTLPQGGANVSVPNFLAPSTSQDKSSAIKVRLIYCVCVGGYIYLELIKPSYLLTVWTHLLIHFLTVRLIVTKVFFLSLLVQFKEAVCVFFCVCFSGAMLNVCSAWVDTLPR